MRRYLDVMGENIKGLLFTTPTLPPRQVYYTPLQALIRAMLFFEEAKDNENGLHEIFLKHIIEGMVGWCGYRARIEESDALGKTPLYYAVECNQFELVDYLINKLYLNPATQDHMGNTLLHITRDKKMVQFLLKNDVTIKPNDQGITPLHIWVKQNDLKNDEEIIRILIQARGGSVNVADHKGNTLLHVAKGNMIKFLLREGATIECNHNGCTPLHFAIKRRDLEGVKYLIELGQCDVNCMNVKGNTPLHLAVKKSNFPIVHYLIETGRCDVNAMNIEGNTPLHFAEGKTEAGRKIIKLLSEKGARRIINSNYHTPLRKFMDNDDIEAIRSFLQVSRAEPEQHLLHKPSTYLSKKSSAVSNLTTLSKQTAEYLYMPEIHSQSKPNVFRIVIETFKKQQDIGLKKSTLDMVMALIETLIHEANQDLQAADGWGNTVLHSAVMLGQVEIVMHLLKLGANSNVKNNRGETPLHLAVKYDQFEIVTHLVALGAPINAQNNEGESALFGAVKRNNMEIVKHLLEQGGDVSVQNNEGETALHVATGARMVGILLQALQQALIKNKEGKKIKWPLTLPLNHAGQSPLHSACIAGDITKVGYLLIISIRNHIRLNVYLTDKKGNTPLSLAQQHEHTAVITLLELMINKQYDELLRKDGLLGRYVKADVPTTVRQPPQKVSFFHTRYASPNAGQYNDFMEEYNSAEESEYDVVGMIPSSFNRD
jgi:ankyrin repeat protein